MQTKQRQLPTLVTIRFETCCGEVCIAIYTDAAPTMAISAAMT